MKKFYITTPIYYLNAQPHIGHAYTTLAADILVRHKRARGQEAYLLTGTDEHGAKVEKSAKAAGKTPQEWTDALADQFRALWRDLGVEYDDFVRTTEPRHKIVVQWAFQRMLDREDIYPGSYEGWYCTPCENYLDESELTQGNCPIHGRPVEKVREQTYFFRLSKYEKRLLDHYEANPDFLAPAWRSSEIVNFVKSGLKDLSVTRTKVAWGVPAHPSAPGHTVYVWFDALLNYVTGAGFDPQAQSAKSEEGPSLSLGLRASNFAELWPADVHLVGKEIFRFHAVIWPAMLMALELPLPRRVFAHGWLLMEMEKISKSRGNIIDPREITAEYGVDALRYFLFREVSFGGDGEFSREAMKKRYNADLANDLGNLLSRVLQLVEKNLGGEIPLIPPVGRELFSEQVKQDGSKFDAAMNNLAFHEALGIVWGRVSEMNRIVDREKPWEKAKSDPDAFKSLMYDLVWSLRILSDRIAPFMPATSARMKEQLGAQVKTAASGAATDPESAWGKVHKGASLFPKKA